MEAVSVEEQQHLNELESTPKEEIKTKLQEITKLLEHVASGASAALIANTVKNLYL